MAGRIRTFEGGIMFRSRILAAGLALAAFGLSGCGASRPPEPPTTSPVRGVVLRADGRPLPGGRLTFIPVTSGRNQATAELNPDGTFELTCSRPNDGAVPGEHVVTIDAFSYRTGTARQVGGVPARYSQQ